MVRPNLMTELKGVKHGRRIIWEHRTAAGNPESGPDVQKKIS